MPALKPLGTLLNAPEYADRVNLIKKIKAAAVAFASVVPEANGRLKDRVRINGQVEVHPEGAYYIEWRDRGKRCRIVPPSPRGSHRPGSPQGGRTARHPRRSHCRSRAGT